MRRCESDVACTVLPSAMQLLTPAWERVEAQTPKKQRVGSSLDLLAAWKAHAALVMRKGSTMKELAEAQHLVEAGNCKLQCAPVADLLWGEAAAPRSAAAGAAEARDRGSAMTAVPPRLGESNPAAELGQQTAEERSSSHAGHNSSLVRAAAAERGRRGRSGLQSRGNQGAAGASSVHREGTTDGANMLEGPIAQRAPTLKVTALQESMAAYASGAVIVAAAATVAPQGHPCGVIPLRMRPAAAH